jgi:hypothetical protein
MAYAASAGAGFATAGIAASPANSGRSGAALATAAAFASASSRASNCSSPEGGGANSSRGAGRSLLAASPMPSRRLSPLALAISTTPALVFSATSPSPRPASLDSFRALSPSAILSQASLLALAAARPARADPRPAARAVRAVRAPVFAASSRERRGISIASTRAGMSARSPMRIVHSAKALLPSRSTRHSPAAPVRIWSDVTTGLRAGASCAG